MPLPHAEYAERLGRLRARMAEKAFDAAYISSPANIAYLSGVAITPHERLVALLVPLEVDPALVVPALEEEAVRENPAGVAIISWPDSEGPFDALRTAFERTNASAVALEKDAVTVRVFEALEGILGNNRFLDCTPLLQELRLQKSAAELKRLERAASIVDAALREVPAMLRPGRTEADVAFELDGLVRRHGSDGTPFDTIVLAGLNAALPHGRPGNREIRDGDLVIVDFGAVHDGYCADVTRTFSIGEPGDRVREIYELVHAAQEAACRAVAPGATCGDVDRAARELIDRAGYGDSFVHRTGHGLGIEVHEPPNLAAGNQDVLAPRTVVTVEPGIYLSGFGGVRIEDDVVVADHGHTRLTRTSRALLVSPA